MNREQFEEQKQGEDFEAIQQDYFDCNALDRLTEVQQASATAEAGEELKMDKDLGLFEMINAGDFQTMSG